MAVDECIPEVEEMGIFDLPEDIVEGKIPDMWSLLMLASSTRPRSC